MPLPRPTCRRAPHRPGLCRSLIWLPLVGVLVGCGSGEGGTAGRDATQIAAIVNDGEISQPQVQHVLQRQSGGAADRSDALAQRVLQGLIDQELAAQQARQLGLDRDSRVVQAMEAAKREVLAGAYHEALADKAQLPSSDEVDRYYDANPALFAQRRFYGLQEITIDAAGTPLDALGAQLEAADAARALQLLRETGRRHAVRQLSVSPEDVPMALLTRLSAMQIGQTLVLPQAGGARALSLLSATPAPLSRDAARRSIQAYLTSERKRQAISDGMKTARDAARIEYKGKFAAAAASTPAAASAPQR